MKNSITTWKKLCLLFFLITLIDTTFAATRRYRLMFNSDPSTEITIAWDQYSGSAPAVYYGTTDFGTAWASYPANSAPYRTVNYMGMNNQFVKLTGLTPNTIYYFVIKDSEGTSQRYWFRTCPNTPSTPLSLISGGDSRSGTTQRINSNKMVAKIRPHAVLFGGDLMNTPSNSVMAQWLDDWSYATTSDNQLIPVVHSYGNHENYGTGGPTILYDLFDVPGDSYYRVNFGGLFSIYSLNTELMPGCEIPNAAKRTAQRNWLQTTLTADNSIWKAAQYHRPIVPHEAGKSDYADEFNDWANNFYNLGVRLVMESDAHVVKVTNEVKPAMATASGNSNSWFTTAGIAANKGITFIGEGSWGTLRPNDDDHPGLTQASGSFYQFSWIIVDQCKIEIRTIDTQSPNSVAEHVAGDYFSISPALQALMWTPSGIPTGIRTITRVSTPSVSIASNDADNTICPGTSVVFTATPTEGGTTPSYQWKVNGVNVGTNSPTYTTSALTNGQIVTCVLTSSNSCASPTNATSSGITMTVVTPSAPTITAGGPTTFCAGGSVVLTSSSAAGNVWSTGATTQSITVSTAGTYTVAVTSGGCTSASSAGTTVTVTPLPSAPTITAGGSTTFCAGGSVVLTSSSATGNLWSNGATTQSITVTSSGNYTVTRTSGGCTSAPSTATTVTVTPVPSTPTITAGGPTTFCAGGSVVLTSSSATGNLWSTGATTQSITVSTAGTYTVAVTSGGCTSASSAGTTVTVTPLPSAPTITAGGSTTFCAGGSVVLTSSSATGNLWSNGATTQSITVTTSGNYTVTRSSGGCTSAPSAATTVIVTPLPSAPTITAGGSTTFCAGGSVVLTSSSATGNLWSTGATTQSITVSTAGTYTVAVTSGGCTSASSTGTTVTVTPLPSAPTITAGGSTTFCAGGSVVLTSSSATGNLWSNGATTQSITATTSGNYTVTRSSGGCTSAPSAATTVTVTPLPSAPTITAGGSTTFCAGGSVVLTSSSATGNLWSTGATTQSITVSTAGTYTVAVTNGGCTSASSTGTTVTVTPLPSAPTITAGGSTTFCAGGSVVLTSSSATGNLWSNGATTQSITVTTSGNYTVTRTSGGCTSAPSTATTVTVTPLPSTPTITAGGSTTFCAGGSVVLTSSSATGNLWSTGATTQSITVTTSGNYTVTRSSGGCTSASSTATTVTVTPLPSAPTITAGGSTTFCAGGSVVLTSSSATGNLWSTGATTQSITVSTAGTYTVAVTSGGCTSASSTGTTVTVTPLPSAPTITAGGSTTFCAGGSVVLTSSSATGNLWSTGATTQSITVSTAGTYTVAVTNGGCTSASSAGTTVTVTPLPSAPTITAGGSTTFCAGGSVVLTSSSATGNLWSTGATTQSITVSTAGTYTVAVTSGGCTSASSTGTTVTVTPLPSAPTITAGGSTTFCAGGSVVLTSSSATGNLWSNGSTSQSITVSSTGNHDVIYTDGNGCSSMSSSTISVTVNPTPAAPTISASGVTTFCEGNSVELTSSAINGNTWSNGSTSQSITVSSTGNHDVLYTDGNGCSSLLSSTTSVTVNPTPVAPTISASGATTFCEGNSVELTSSAINGNMWSNGSTSQSITVSSTGNHDVLYTDGNGCSSLSSSTTSVTVNPLPEVTLTVPDLLCFESNLTSLNGGIPLGGIYSGLGINGSTFDPQIAGIGQHEITYTFSNSNGCSNSETQMIEVQSCLSLQNSEIELFRIYPNPAFEFVLIEGTDPLVKLNVEVYDANGRLVFVAKEVNSPTEISVRGWARGVYDFVVKTKSTSITKKVVIE